MSICVTEELYRYLNEQQVLKPEECHVGIQPLSTNTQLWLKRRLQENYLDKVFKISRSKQVMWSFMAVIEIFRMTSYSECREINGQESRTILVNISWTSQR